MKQITQFLNEAKSSCKMTAETEVYKFFTDKKCQGKDAASEAEAHFGDFGKDKTFADLVKYIKTDGNVPDEWTPHMKQEAYRAIVGIYNIDNEYAEYPDPWNRPGVNYGKLIPYIKSMKQ